MGNKIIKASEPDMHWDYGYVKKVEGKEESFMMLDGCGRPSREVKTVEWDLHQYINHCLFPVHDCIEKMGKTSDQDTICEYVDILNRLYDAALLQLNKMNKAIYKDLGWIKIVTTNEDCYGGFMHQDFLEVHVNAETAEVQS